MIKDLEITQITSLMKKNGLSEVELKKAESQGKLLTA